LRKEKNHYKNTKTLD